MTTTSPPANLTNADLIRWTFDRLNDHDLSSLKQVWASDTVERFPDRTCHGTDEIVQYFEQTFAAIPDFHMELRAIAASGEDVFVQWRLTGTHDGPLQGLEPTHKRIEVDGMDHFVIRDGRLVSNFIVFDQMQYARQIGMMPPDGSSADKAVKAAFNAKTKLAARLKR